MKTTDNFYKHIWVAYIEGLTIIKDYDLKIVLNENGYALWVSYKGATDTDLLNFIDKHEKGINALVNIVNNYDIKYYKEKYFNEAKAFYEELTEFLKDNYE